MTGTCFHWESARTLVKNCNPSMFGMLMSERIREASKPFRADKASAPSLASRTSPRGKSVCERTRTKIFRIAAESSTISTLIFISKNLLRVCSPKAASGNPVGLVFLATKLYRWEKLLSIEYFFPKSQEKPGYIWSKVCTYLAISKGIFICLDRLRDRTEQIRHGNDSSKAWILY